jgi:hypothetical protein
MRHMYSDILDVQAYWYLAVNLATNGCGCILSLFDSDGNENGCACPVDVWPLKLLTCVHITGNNIDEVES